MLVLGVTGDVGAGKSTVAGLWKNHGASIIDADCIIHEIWKEPRVLKRVEERWGSCVFYHNGSINPSEIASRIFADPKEYEWLCSILHPMVRKEMERRMFALRGWIVAEIPLLFENSVPWWVDYTVYVTASTSTRLSRNVSRGWNEEEIERRERFLMNTEEKQAMADLVIQNEGSLESLEESLLRYAVAFKKMAALCVIQAYSSDEKSLRRAAVRLGASGWASRVEVQPLVNALMQNGRLSMGKRYLLRAYSYEFYWRFVEELLKNEGVNEVELLHVPRLSAALRNDLVEEMNG